LAIDTWMIKKALPVMTTTETQGLDAETRCFSKIRTYYAIDLVNAPQLPAHQWSTNRHRCRGALKEYGVAI